MFMCCSRRFMFWCLYFCKNCKNESRGECSDESCNEESDDGEEEEEENDNDTGEDELQEDEPNLRWKWLCPLLDIESTRNL